MKKLKKSKFNESTGMWESQPVRYVDFHCSPKEWSGLGNGKFYLIRDYIKSLDLKETAWDGEECATVMDIINQAVKTIISNRYDVEVKEIEKYSGDWYIKKQTVWEVSIPNVPKRPPYNAYVTGLYDYHGERCAIKLYEPIIPEFEWEYDRQLIAAIAGVCDAIFYLIKSTTSRYYNDYVSGKYIVSTGISGFDKLKL